MTLFFYLLFYIVLIPTFVQPVITAASGVILYKMKNDISESQHFLLIKKTILIVILSYSVLLFPLSHTIISNIWPLCYLVNLTSYSWETINEWNRPWLSAAILSTFIIMLSVLSMVFNKNHKVIHIVIIILNALPVIVLIFFYMIIMGLSL